MIVYVDTPLNKDQKNALRKGAHNDKFIFKDELPNESECLNALLSAEILLGNPRPVEWLQQATNLKWVQLYSTGFEYYRNVSIPAVITNMQDYYSQPCAETAVAGILALYRGMDTFGVLKDQKKWVGYPLRAQLQLLHGKRVIILGTGNIGKGIEAILKCFNCDISFYGRTSPSAVLKTSEQLENALTEADIVIACLPGTEETKGLFTAGMIRKMRPSAIFCNVGRGNLVADEDELVDALMHRRIGGAVLDVTIKEPLPDDHPLWNCPNTILSQHSGGGNVSEYDGIVDFFLENFKNFKENKPLKNRVELSRGY